MMHPRPRAGILIEVDSQLSISCQFEGREELLIGLVGACDYAKSWLMDRVKETQGIAGSWPHKHPAISESLAKADEEKYTSEQEVSRDDALKAYEYAIEAMRLRVESIKKSPLEAKFTIDPVLLSQL